MSEYKCQKCKSVWNTDKSVLNCPFCGNALVAPMNESPKVIDMNSLIKKIRSELGQDAFSKENYKNSCVIAYMLDYAPEFKSQILLFKIALESNIYYEFQKAQNGNINLSRIKHNLREQYYLNDPSIESIVDWFCVIFNVDNSTKNVTKTSSVKDQSKENKHNLRCSNVPENNGLKEILIKMYLSKMDNTFLSSNIEGVRSLAEIDDIDGAFYLGRCYHLGLGVNIDIENAIKWYEKAISHQHPIAMSNLGAIYDERFDTNRAYFYYYKALENGFAMAAHNIAQDTVKSSSLDDFSTIDLMNGLALTAVKQSTPNRYQGEKDAICWKYVFSAIGFSNAVHAINVIEQTINKLSNVDELTAQMNKYGESHVKKIVEYCDVNPHIADCEKYKGLMNESSQLYRQKYDTNIIDNEFVKEKSWMILKHYQAASQTEIDQKYKNNHNNTYYYHTGSNDKKDTNRQSIKNDTFTFNVEQQMHLPQNDESKRVSDNRENNNISSSQCNQPDTYIEVIDQFESSPFVKNNVVKRWTKDAKKIKIKTIAVVKNNNTGAIYVVFQKSDSSNYFISQYDKITTNLNLLGKNELFRVGRVVVNNMHILNTNIIYSVTLTEFKPFIKPLKGFKPEETQVTL